MIRERSKKQLGDDLTTLIHDLYVGCLDRAEKILRLDTRLNSWQQFRFEILNMGNASQREIPIILRDYQIEFRPVIFSVEYKIDGKIVDSLNNLPGISFGWDKRGQPELIISVGGGEKALEAANKLAESLKCGNVYTKEGGYVFAAYGLWDAYFKIIPFFDTTKAVKGSALPKYLEWKEQVLARV